MPGVSLSLRTFFLGVVAWVKVLRYILGHMWLRVLGSPCDPFKCGQSQNVVQRRACGCWNRLCRARAPGHRTSPDTISVRGAGMAIVEGTADSGFFSQGAKTLVRVCE